jgi:CRP-like cAMP-binding protein
VFRREKAIFCRTVFRDSISMLRLRCAILREIPARYEIRSSFAPISYLAGISRKMAHLSRSIEILSLKTVRQKIAFSLLNTEENTEKSSGGGIPVNVTRFASEINCSREAVSRAFTAMEADGLVKRYPGFVVIPDKQRLESLI